MSNFQEMQCQEMIAGREVFLSSWRKDGSNPVGFEFLMEATVTSGRAVDCEVLSCTSVTKI